MLRVLTFIGGVGMVVGVIFLGVQTTHDNSLVIWFGLASAILVPLGFAMAGFAFSAGDRLVLRRLAKVPEVDRLIQQAKSQEERIRLLQEERQRLVEVVELEAQKQALLTQRARAEKEAVRTFEHLESIEAGLKDLDEKISLSPLCDEVRQLHDRIAAKRKGDFVFRIAGTEFTLRRDLLLQLPGGPILVMYLELPRMMTRVVRDLIGHTKQLTKRSS